MIRCVTIWILGAREGLILESEIQDLQELLLGWRNSPINSRYNYNVSRDYPGQCDEIKSSGGTTLWYWLWCCIRYHIAWRTKHGHHDCDITADTGHQERRKYRHWDRSRGNKERDEERDRERGRDAIHSPSLLLLLSPLPLLQVGPIGAESVFGSHTGVRERERERERQTCHVMCVF